MEIFVKIGKMSIWFNSPLRVKEKIQELDARIKDLESQVKSAKEFKKILQDKLQEVSC